ncbi:MAG: L,D-transpeptidase family protein [Croceibacterium sp.]
MSPIAKWIGGTSAALTLLVGGAVYAGRTIEANANDPEQWLREDATTAAAPAPVEPAALVRPAAKPQAEPFVIKRILPIKGAIKYGEWHWDDTGVADGPIVITVDLDARVLSVFKGGYEIGAAAVLLGTPEHPTPTGTFPIMSKERHNVSEIYGNAPMPWSLRLTGDGVAIHGGRPVENGWASHGCIGTPNDFASKLFATTHPGDKVIITRGKTARIGSRLT